MVKSICVFCGAKSGTSPIYAKAARLSGQAIARAGMRLVFGGGRIGLMGVVAEAAREAGGQVTGIMPRALAEREIADERVESLEIVESMHERKLRMADLSDAFLALPGGAGTLEEIFEQWTWAQLGIHQKPCGFLNVDGYFDPLLDMIARITAEGFMAPEYAAMLIVERDINIALARFNDYRAPEQRWPRDVVVDGE